MDDFEFCAMHKIMYMRSRRLFRTLLLVLGNYVHCLLLRYLIRYFVTYLDSLEVIVNSCRASVEKRLLGYTNSNLCRILNAYEDILASYLCAALIGRTSK